MKPIFIVLSFTGTPLSKVVVTHMKHQYAHVSLGLDDELDELYSFGRLHPYNAFRGGLVREGINHGTFKRFKHTKVAVYRLTVTAKQYRKIEAIIRTMWADRRRYKFNILGMFLVKFNKKLSRKDYFYCAEFLRHVLDEAGVDITHLPDIISPQDFMQLSGMKLTYEGLLREYPAGGILDGKKEEYGSNG
jgi:hypothetical protein